MASYKQEVLKIRASTEVLEEHFGPRLRKADRGAGRTCRAYLGHTPPHVGVDGCLVPVHSVFLPEGTATLAQC